MIPGFINYFQIILYFYSYVRVISYKFKISIAEVNSILGNQQIENILTTLRFIENKERKGEKINTIRTGNIQKCISWCVKNKIPHYKTGNTGNIFMTNRKVKSEIKNWT